jgi:beta-glucosidase
MDMPGNILDLSRVYDGGDFPIFEQESHFGANLTIGVLNGSIPVERIDGMATRIMAAYYKIKLDEIRPQRGPPTFSEFTEADTGNLYLPVGKGPVVPINEHMDVRTQFSSDASYNVATEAIVLLKNEHNTLPLNDKKEGSRISVLGLAAFPNSNDQCLGEGNKGCSLEMQQGAALMGGGSGTTQSTTFITPFEAVNERVRRDKASMRYFKGSNTSDPMFISTATHSDVNLIFAQIYVSENQDLENDTLWYGADQVIEDACRVNKNNVVVITAPGPVNMEKWIDNENVTAVIYTPYLGQVAGKAIVDVLYGEHGVSGRLPFTISKSKQEIVPVTNDTHPNPTILREALDDELLKAGLYIDYRYFDHKNITPRYEFGFGLSYTKFNFSDIKVETIKAPSERLPRLRNGNPHIPTIVQLRLRNVSSQSIR